MVDDVITTNATPTPVSPQANEPSAISIIERAEKLNKETKEAEERIIQHRKAMEELETRRIMGGQTFAGSINKTAEQIKQEEAQKIANEITNAFRRK